MCSSSPANGFISLNIWRKTGAGVRTFRKHHEDAEFKKRFFSDLYSDIETGEMIRTFSYPMDDNMYLFIDLPYSYLYEQDGLL